jgi:transcriptional regulator with XRE-family HTH domain
MNEITNILSYSDDAILKEVCNFVKQRRIDQHLTQQELAKSAAVSRSTISLLERGENISLINLIKILRILDALYVFEQFHVKPQVSPMLLAKEAQKKRKRVYHTDAERNNVVNEPEDLGW